jgi:hypothetical protein
MVANGLLLFAVGLHGRQTVCEVNGVWSIPEYRTTRPLFALRHCIMPQSEGYLVRYRATDTSKRNQTP